MGSARYDPNSSGGGAGAGQGLTLNGSNLDNNLITGVSGGQTITGGTAAGDSLSIRASSAGSPTGKIRVGNTGAVATLTVVEGGTNGQNLVGINNEGPAGQIDVRSTGNLTALFINGGSGAFTTLRVGQSGALTGIVLTGRSTAGTIAGITSAGAGVTMDSSLGAMVIGSTAAFDVVFVTNSAENLRIQQSTGLLKTAAAMTVANGSVATTVTSLGPTGSHTTIQEWLTFLNSAGTQRWIPCY